MSENLHNSGSHENHGDYEREDFSTGAVVGSLVGLGVMCIVSFFIVVGMYRYLEKTQMEHAAANPMVPMEADTRHMTPGKLPGDAPMEVQAFPKPRLQTDDVQEMREQLYGEESQLQSYGWVDESAGEARIPIARAMELTVERGLPVHNEASSAAAVKPEPVAPAKHSSPVRKAAKKSK
jgi:hypothetical protein